MPDKKSSEKNIRKLTKMGGGKSFGITLPIEMVRQLKWKERQKISVRKSGKKIILQDWE